MIFTSGARLLNATPLVAACCQAPAVVVTTGWCAPFQALQELGLEPAEPETCFSGEPVQLEPVLVLAEPETCFSGEPVQLVPVLVLAEPGTCFSGEPVQLVPVLVLAGPETCFSGEPVQLVPVLVLAGPETCFSGEPVGLAQEPGSGLWTHVEYEPVGFEPATSVSNALAG